MPTVMWCLVAIGAFLVIYMLEECIEDFYPYIKLNYEEEEDV